MKVIYFDCFSGISGDMTLAALVDAGANPERIEEGIEKLLGQKINLNFEPVVKKGVSAKKLRMTIDGYELVNGLKVGCHHHEEAHHHHDHDHHHEEAHHHHGHGHEHHHHEEEHHHPDHDHHHEEAHHHPDHHHHHEGAHHHHDDHHHGLHRHYSDIVAMIERAGFDSTIQEWALKIFYEIGKAEAKIHNIPMERVHFHEVGAIDSIVDIVGTAIALKDLGVEQIISSPVAVGSGYVKCDHGLYPVPAPATLEMLKNIPIRTTQETGELTTPTGAGILAALSERFGPLPAFTIQSIGYGAGTKELKMQPNVLRVIVGEVE